MGGASALLDAKKILHDIGLRPGDHVADFGAGRTGHFVFPSTAIVGERGVVYAVDLVKEVLQMIEGRCKLFSLVNLHTVWGDFERKGGVKIPEHSLDWIFVINNAWCVKDLGVLVGEIQRLIKPTGKVLVIDWRRHAEHPAAPVKERRLDALQVEAQFLRGGIAKERDIQINGTHWGMILKGI